MVGSVCVHEHAIGIVLNASQIFPFDWRMRAARSQALGIERAWIAQGTHDHWLTIKSLGGL